MDLALVCQLLVVFDADGQQPRRGPDVVAEDGFELTQDLILVTQCHLRSCPELLGLAALSGLVGGEDPENLFERRELTERM